MNNRRGRNNITFITRCENPPEVDLLDAVTRVRRYRDQLRHYLRNCLTITDWETILIRNELGKATLWLNKYVKLIQYETTD